jgi:uncharacterized integral membrane protein (TIGR00698 family)
MDSPTPQLASSTPRSELPPSAASSAPSARGPLSEDWTAVIIGLLVLSFGLLTSFAKRPDNIPWDVTEQQAAEGALKWDSPFKAWLGKPGKWQSQPLDAFREPPPKNVVEGSEVARKPLVAPLVGAFAATLLIGLGAIVLRARRLTPFIPAFIGLFLLATLAYVLAGQVLIAKYNLEYALWALLVGLLIANTVGTPHWLRPAVLGEQYIKIGLILLGAEVLLGRLLALGLPGIFISWVVTPVVLISTYLFGQRVLKLQSKSLNMVISADMSVCGVSAAIATAAACRAKREELSLAIGLSLSFTVVMMIVLPWVAKTLNMDPTVAGAWIGGTIDATGAVAAAGEALGKAGSETAVTIKMIQNILIGVIAFGVAIYWTRWVETHENSSTQNKIGIGEIWIRFPKFVLGFVAASLVFTLLFAMSTAGELWVNSVVGGFAKPIRDWLFCLAFVCIGLDTNFRMLLPYFRSGKPAALYICGQTLNLILTLLMAYLMFGILFPQATAP